MTIILDMDFPEIASLLWKQNRLKTFKKWPFKNSDKCNVESMAAAGFYFVGNQDEPDLVECFICNKQLDGWESHDDPWTEHVKHKPDCFFVTLNKMNEKDWTVEELYKLYKKHQYNKYVQDSTSMLLKLQDEAAALKNELFAMHQKNSGL